MKTKTKRILWCMVMAAVVVCGLAFYQPRHQPIARMPLPDGTELRFEYLTYGTEHRIPGVGPIIAWGSRLAQRWPRLQIALHAAEYRYTTPDPLMVLWFTCYDPKTGKYLPRIGGKVRVEGVDRTGFFAEEGLQFAEAMMPTPCTGVEMYLWNRRSAELKLRITCQGFAKELMINNPAAKIPFPQWQPESLPQTRRVGQLEVTLQTLRVLPFDSAPAVEPIFEVRHEGRLSRGLRFETRILDATGNATRSALPPPFSEPTWKVQSTVWRTGDYPFAETEGQIFGPAPVPREGQHEILALLKGNREPELRLVALLGAGEYWWRDGAFVDRSAAFDAQGIAGAKNTLTIRCSNPVLVLLYLYPDDAAANRKVQERAEERAIRFRWDHNAENLAENNRYDINNTASFSGSGVGVHYCYKLPVTTDGDLLAPPGTAVTVQIVPAKPETLEFLVAPPILSRTDE